MSRQMFRYEVPVDDAVHLLPLTSDPVAVAIGGSNAYGYVMEFWAEHDDREQVGRVRAFRVFGTGHLLPEGARWVGTCPRMSSGFVFHLYEVTP